MHPNSGPKCYESSLNLGVRPRNSPGIWVCVPETTGIKVCVPEIIGNYWMGGLEAVASAAGSARITPVLSVKKCRAGDDGVAVSV